MTSVQDPDNFDLDPNHINTDPDLAKWYRSLWIQIRLSNTVYDYFKMFFLNLKLVTMLQNWNNMNFLKRWFGTNFPIFMSHKDP